jgi:hypothetical protein
MEAPPTWVPDEDVAACYTCQDTFGFFTKVRLDRGCVTNASVITNLPRICLVWTHECRIAQKHHCRNCGRIFCHDCCGTRMPLPKFGYDEAVRVCGTCITDLEEVATFEGEIASMGVPGRPDGEYTIVGRRGDLSFS